MMSNPELLRLATEGMKNLRTEDVKRAAEQLKHTRPEDMVEISEKISKAKPEEIAAMKAHADAQISYELNGAKMLKQQGNELHSRGQYEDAAEKYMLAKNNLKSIPPSSGQMLQLQCSLNLMSCYLKTRQFEECIKEGSEVLAYDLENIKALYRRGQAYKELGKLEAAVADLKKSHEISPDDETIADAFRDANEKLMREGKNRSTSQGVVIEEIVEDEVSAPSRCHEGSSVEEYSVTQAVESAESSSASSSSPDTPVFSEHLNSFRDDPSAIRSFQNYVSNANPDTLAQLGMQGMSPDLVKTAQDMLSTMKPEELQQMFQVASSLKEKGPYGPKLGNNIPEMTPEMVKMASNTISKMSPDELQKMLKMASSLGVNAPQRSESASQSLASSSESPSAGPYDSRDNISDESLFSQRMGESSSSTSTSAADLQETMRNSMKDPAMRQMFASMMKNMSPDMMANMSEQFGMKMSKEDAAKAQQAMSALSPADLDRMLRWAEKAQRGVETVKKTKNWVLGRPGLILAIVMLVLAFILHRLGFIGG
ncbi:Outer envelope protein 61 [Ananas comosus]|nr:Outer envelope protein 61 [Ananas comosus]